MFKAGDNVQAYDRNEWYNAKIIRRMEDADIESYEVHYKGWNKRFDCVKYLRDIRHPEIIINDPLPSPKTKSRLEKQAREKVQRFGGRIAKKGTHMKLNEILEAESKKKSPVKVKPKQAKKSQKKRVQDPTVTTSASSGAIDDDDIPTPNKTEANALRRIRSEIKAKGHTLSQDEIDELKREYRRSALRASQEFVKRAVLKFEMKCDDDAIHWEDVM